VAVTPGPSSTIVRSPSEKATADSPSRKATADSPSRKATADSPSRKATADSLASRVAKPAKPRKRPTRQGGPGARSLLTHVVGEADLHRDPARVPGTPTCAHGRPVTSWPIGCKPGTWLTLPGNDAIFSRLEVPLSWMQESIACPGCRTERGAEMAMRTASTKEGLRMAEIPHLFRRLGRRGAASARRRVVGGRRVASPRRAPSR